MGSVREKDGFPQVPPSLRHDAYEMQDFSGNRKRSLRALFSHNAGQGITPYLGLRARLSQIWFNRWTVLLILVLVHFLLTLASLNDGLDDAKVKALSACTKVEDIGSAMASMPHYLSVGVNRLTASGITNSVHALMTILDMILTGIEQLILFVIGMMTDTYVCLITMVVHGGLNASALAVTKTTDAINDAIGDIAKTINSTAEDLQKPVDTIYGLVNGAVDTGNQATSAVGGAVETATKGIGSVASDLGNGLGGLFGRADDEPAPPEVTSLFVRADIPAKPEVAGDIQAVAAKLSNVHIDSSGFVKDLDDLNEKLPTFDDVKNLTSQAVSIPFDLIRQELDKAYGDWSFNDSVFPVAQKEALSFCSDNSVINDFFEKLFEIAHTAKIVAIVVLILLAIAACVPMGYMEIHRWNSAQNHARNAYDDMDLVYRVSRPISARVGDKFGSWFGQRRRLIARWCFAYATSLPALFVLSLALAGFFSCLCQYILLKTIEKEVPALASEVGGFADQVVDTLGNVSQKWADDANGVITSFSTEINDDILGKVTNATSTVNNTINTFQEEINKGLTIAFGDTLFKDLVQQTLRCLIGLKVEAFQKGLTWVHDHAHINFPMFPNDVFSVGAQKSISGDSDLTTFLASPSSVTTDEVTGAVTHVTTWLHNNIVQTALISTGLTLVYVIVILIGVISALAGHNNPAAETRRLRIRNLGDGGDGYGDPAQMPPRSPRRTRSEASMQSPRFGVEGGMRHPGYGGSGSPYAQDDNNVGTVRGGAVTTEEVPPYTRTSSYVTYGDAKR
ncbi:hypothetical protein F5B20DRAFT_319689 [Whalleya microplaca]|nr:hypothetical protein F5B20DRAFT_319689 [Whalleya microplaca]